MWKNYVKILYIYIFLFFKFLRKKNNLDLDTCKIGIKTRIFKLIYNFLINVFVFFFLR